MSRCWSCSLARKHTQRVEPYGQRRVRCTHIGSHVSLVRNQRAMVTVNRDLLVFPTILSKAAPHCFLISSVEPLPEQREALRPMVVSSARQRM